MYLSRRDTRWRSLCSGGMVLLLALSSAPRVAAAQAETTPKLKINILEGEGAVNSIRQRTARDPIVEVVDENNKPVSGAVVMFTLPGRGASGVFPNGAQSVTLTTNAQGRAVATGLRANNVAGDFQIRVNASHQGRTASTTISQTNSVGAAAAAGATAVAGISAKVITIVAIVAGAAVGGVIVAKNGNGGPAQRPPTSITPGSPTVGQPR